MEEVREKKIICQNPLHKLYLKKQLFELKMNEGIDVSDHITKFNKCVTQLLSVKIKINKENQIIILLASLPKSYEAIMITLLIGKTTLTLGEKSMALLEIENIIAAK